MISVSRFFHRRLKAIPAANSYTALFERAAKLDGRSAFPSVQIFLIQTTRPLAFIVRTWKGPEIYLSKILVSECTDEQLQMHFVRLAHQLNQQSIRIWWGSFFVASGWKFESISLARFALDDETDNASRSLGFFGLLKILVLLPLWRISWHFSRSNRYWVRRVPLEP